MVRISTVTALVCYFGAILTGFAQTATSQATGDWSSPGTWSCNCVPTSASHTQINIQANHVVTVSTAVTAQQVTVLSGGTLRKSGAGTITATGITVQNGGTYDHAQNGLAIPTITWQTGSTCKITGWVGLTAGTDFEAFLSSLGQSFHHFTWESAGQTASTVVLRGALTTVNGDLTINSTNAPGTGSSRRVILGFNAGSGTGTTTVGGNLNVNGASLFAVNLATGTGIYTLNVGGNVVVNTTNTSTAGALLFQSSEGVSNVNITGNFQMTQGSFVAVGSGTANLNVTGNVLINGGTFNFSNNGGPAAVNIAGNLALNGGTWTRTAGTGAVNFTGGTGLHTYTRGTATLPNQPVTYSVAANNTLDLGTYELGPAGGAGNFNNDGTVIVRSLSTDGAIGGNIPTPNRVFSSGSKIVYGGAAGQYMGFGHPADAGVATDIDNASGVTLVADATIGGTLTLINGNLNLDAFKLTLNGNIVPNSNTLAINPASSIEIGGSGALGAIPLSGGPDLMNFALNRTAGSVTLGGDLTINGTFDQFEGALLLNGHTLTVLGDYNAETANITSTAASSLVINNSGSLPTSMEITGSMNTLSLATVGGFTLDVSPSTFTVSNLNLIEGALTNDASMSVAAGGTITRGNGTMSDQPGGSGSYNLVYTNSPDPISTGPEFHSLTSRMNNVTVMGDAEVTLAANRTVNGALTVISGGFNAGTTTITLRGDLIIDSPSTMVSATTVFGGTTTISGSEVPDLGNVTVSSTATLNLPAETRVSGTLTFNAGSTVNHNNGNIILAGGSLQTVNANNTVLYNVTVNKSVNTNVTLSTGLQLAGILNVVTTNSNFLSNGFLTLLSTSDGPSGTAAIGPLMDGANVSGDVTVQRYMSSEGRIYRYISSPTTNATIAQVQDDFPVTGNFTGTSTCSGCSTTPSFYYYDPAIVNYVAYPTTNVNAPLQPGLGYSAFVRQTLLPGPVTWDVTGPINRGTIPLPVQYNTTSPETWNLVGNPYPATIDWDNEAGWVKANVGSIAVRDNGVGGIFHYWNGTTGDLDGEIATRQAFWVQTINTDPVLIINEQAKTTATGSFYRNAEANVLSVKLTKGSIWDRTYVQLDDQAVRGADKLDATKLANDYFDFSTRFANEPRRMAINATNEITCGAELILDLQFTKNSKGAFNLVPEGSYTMEFSLSGSKFQQYKITLVDQYTGQSQVVSDNFSFTVAMTKEAASYAPDRFKLVFDGKAMPNLALQTNGVAAVCSNGEATLVIEGSENDFEYYLLGTNNAELSSHHAGNGGALALSVPATSLAEGLNKISIGVNGFCGESRLASVWEVVRQVVAAPTVAAAKHCQPGSVQLTASGAGAAGTYRWYETQDAVSPVGTGATFATPALPKSKTYYAAIVTAEGCEGIRQPALAEVVLYDEVTIAAAGGDVLSSSYATGNQWYFNEQPIAGATGQSLKADKSGMYSVEVAVGGCTSTGNMEYLVTGNIDEVVAAVSGFPNPAWKEINVSLKGPVREITSVDITNVTGQAIGRVNLQGSANEKSGSMNVEQLMQGVYFVKIQLPAKTMVFKFVKQ